MAKKKKQKGGQQGQQFLSPAQYLRQKARSLEIGTCYVSDDIRTVGEGYVVVSRLHNGGRVSVGVYLVDAYCLGVKDSFYRLRMDPEDFDELIDTMPNVNECSYEEAHNWVYGAIAFAEEAGIAPSKNFGLSQYLLEEDTDDIPLIEYEFGKDGQHFLVCHSNLEASRYMSLLKKNLGDNFKFVIGDEPKIDFDRLNDFDPEKFMDSPFFKTYGPSTEYTYEHPDYQPKKLSFTESAFQRIISDPRQAKLISDKDIASILNLPHGPVREKLEHILMYHIGLTCDGVSDDYDENGFAPIIPIGLALLGEVGNENSSLEVLLEVLRQTEDFYEYHFGDWASDVLVAPLYKLGQHRLGRLMEFMREPGLYDMFKCYVCDAVTQIGLHQPERRAEIVSWYQQLIRYATEVLPKTQYIDSMLAGMLLNGPLDLQAKELLPDIRKMFDTGLVDLKCCGDFQQVSRSIANPRYAGHPESLELDVYKQIGTLRGMVGY